jgi:peptide/nickel transport system substrate-binding protein
LVSVQVIQSTKEDIGMKSKVLLLLVALLAIMGQSLMAGGGNESSAEPGSASAADDGPQYGGTITWVGHTTTPQSWDIGDAFWLQTFTHGPFYDGLLEGDVFSYGPRGSDEFSFTAKNFVPEEFVRGALAESWEVTPDQIIFKIRKGIMWALGPDRESRELTAHDIVASHTRSVERRRESWPGSVAFINEYRALDDYTLVLDMSSYNAAWSNWVGYGHNTLVQPPEVTESNPSVWNSHVGVGTGPFLLKDYVEQSHIEYERNPNWFRSPITVDGTEYDVPFVDTLRYVYPGDEAAAVAALRTGRVDWYWNLPATYLETLEETSPDLILGRIFRGDQFRVVLRCDEPPFDDIRVRKAATLAVDQEAVGRAVLGESVLHAFPTIPAGGPVYIPMEDLPESTRDFYAYDPEKARTLLSEAGYPDGFQAELLVETRDPRYGEAAQIVKAMWDAVGIETEVNVTEHSVYSSLLFGDGDYKFAAVNASPKVDPLAAFDGYATAGATRYEDEYAQGIIDQVLQETDGEVRTAMLQDLGVYMMEQNTMIVIGAAQGLNAWWPWMKNYYGEAFPAVNRWSMIQGTVWIDEDLKDSLGY